MFSRIVYRLVLVSALVLAALVAAGFAGAEHPLFDSIGNLRLHLTVALAICNLLLCFWRGWRAIGFLTTLVVLSTLTCLFVFPPEQYGEAGKLLKIVQFNTLFKNPSPRKSADWIASQSPDFVTLQEVSRNTNQILDALKLQWPNQILCKFATVGGVAVASKHPILESKCIEGEGFVWARIGVDGREITVASLHLHWPYPYGQAKQLARLENELLAMPHPVVLAGDFNAAPWSHTVRQVEQMTETARAPGFRLTLRMGPPHIGPMALLPIDHVLYPRYGSVRSVEVGPPIGSDHLPVVTEFSFD